MVVVTLNLKISPFEKVSKEIALAIKYNISLNPLSKNLIESNPLNSKIYGLPKVHNTGVPLRPTINTVGQPSYLLAKFLAQKLKPLIGCT